MRLAGPGAHASVVALEDNLLAMPAISRELLAHPGNHVVKATNIRMDVEFKLARWSARRDGCQRKRLTQPRGTLLHNSRYVLLHIAAQPFPAVACAAQC